MNIIDELVEFRDARGWAHHHTPSNLAKSITIEAAELLECFQWGEPPDMDGVLLELADVIIYALTMCHQLGVDPRDIVRHKMELNAEKYPAPQPSNG